MVHQKVVWKNANCRLKWFKYVIYKSRFHLRFICILNQPCLPIWPKAEHYLSHWLQASKLCKIFLADTWHDKPRYSAKILAPLDLGLGFFSLLNMAFGHMGCLMSVPWWMASFTNISFESTIVVTIKLQYTIIAPRAQQFKDHNMFTVVQPSLGMIPRGIWLGTSIFPIVLVTFP